MSRANFVQVQLAQAATDIQTTLSVKAPTGGFKLPPADGGRLVLTDSLGQPSAFEVITYTGRTGSGPYTLTGVVRGVEGTVGLAWGVDTFVLQALTVGDLQELMDSKLGVGATAVAAVKLANARTINGVAFDGSANITVADATKEPAIPAGTTAQYVAGDKTLRTFAADVRAAVLTGLSTATNSAIAAADTVLAAFGKLQAQITGLATSKLDATANAVSASKLQTARTITLTGDVAGSASFDGSGNVSINAQVANDSHTHSLGNLGLGTAATKNVGTSIGDVVEVGSFGLGNAKKVTDFAERIDSGFYLSIGTSANRPTGMVADGGWMINLNWAVPGVGNRYNCAFYGNVQDNFIGFRRINHLGEPQAPVEIYHSGNISSVSIAATQLTGTIPDARLSGTYTGVNITGNAATATKLATARTIALSGDVTGSGSFDGSGNLTIAATVADNSHGHSIADVSGLQDALNAASGLAEVVQDPNGAVNQVILSNHANTPNGILGTGFYWHITTTFYEGFYTTGNRAQIAVQYNGGNQCFARSSYDGVWTSWVRLDNSSVDAAALTGVIADARLSGTYTGVNITGNATTATKLATARTIGGVSFDGTANINLPGVNAAGNQNTSGNAATATKLATGRTIGMTGDVTWTSPAFDGSGNVTAAATLANSGVAAGTYGKVTVNVKGLVTAGAALTDADIPSLDTGKLTTGTLPIARGGTGGATATAARTALGIGSMATRNVTISTADPSGGVDGDIWFKYEL